MKVVIFFRPFRLIFFRFYPVVADPCEAAESRGLTIVVVCIVMLLLLAMGMAALLWWYATGYGHYLF